VQREEADPTDLMRQIAKETFGFACNYYRGGNVGQALKSMKDAASLGSSQAKAFLVGFKMQSRKDAYARRQGQELIRLLSENKIDEETSGKIVEQYNKRKENHYHVPKNSGSRRARNIA